MNKSIAIFLVEIDGISYLNEEKLRFAKQRARSGLIISIADNLLGIVIGKTNPTNSWNPLRRMYSRSFF